MAELFGRERSVIAKHIRNVFQEKELDPGATCAKFAQVQTEGRRTVSREVDHFSLDVIISVGYRVKSLRGTQFRVWATRTLRDHLLSGYTLNERRLRQRGLDEIEQAVELMARTLKTHALVSEEGQVVLSVVQRYTRAWRLLFEFDEERLKAEPSRPVPPAATLSLVEAREAAGRLRADLSKRHESGGLFGQEQSDGLARILGAIEQTFDGKPLYTSAQSRAAHLLYFVIKDHPFGDGNKRIGALLFLEYLRRNDLLLLADGSPRLGDNAMVALALLIAESEPRQKDLMVRLVLNLLEDERP
jgi:prophage maintenance system killer protein